MRKTEANQEHAHKWISDELADNYGKISGSEENVLNGVGDGYDLFVGLLEHGGVG